MTCFLKGSFQGTVEVPPDRIFGPKMESYVARVFQVISVAMAAPYSHVDTPAPVRSLKLSNVGSG